MKVERPGMHSPTPQEQKQLEKIRSTVAKAAADGVLTREEYQRIQTVLCENGTITSERLTVVRSTITEVLGDADLEYEWF